MSYSADIDFRGTERFEVQRRLGHGGMGVVYKALDKERNTLVALKTLTKLDAQGIYRFKKEFRALADIQHRNLISLGELICESGQWFFTMELVEGVDFIRWVRGRGTLPEVDGFEATGPGKTASEFDEGRLRDALTQLAWGVSALHTAGKVHRDIKPSNILVDKSGRVVLLDFGLVAETDQNPDNASATDMIEAVGTAAYMAPEQAAAKPVGPPADWYSVGVMLYEALTGKQPFDGTPLQILLEKQQKEPAPPKTVLPDLAEDLSSLCGDLLRLMPEKRPSGVDILRRLGATEDERSYTLVAQATMTQGFAPFVGREAEMEKLRAAYDATRAGDAVTLYVKGESGVGKSHLSQRFADDLQLTEQELVVLQSRCYERESVPFKAFDGIVDALSRYLRKLDHVDAALLLPHDTAVLARVFPVLKRVPVVARMPQPRQRAGDPQSLRTRAFLALREIFQRLAQRAPLVLVIDDLQWADQDSLTLLGEVMHPPGAPALLLIATVRTTEEVADDIDSRLPFRPDGRTVREMWVKALGEDKSLELVRLLLGRTAGGFEERAEAIVREAQGHPLFIQELVRHVALLGASAPATIRLEEALWERVVRVSKDARHVLEIVTVAGTPIKQETAALAAELEGEAFQKSVATLRVANLVRTTGGRGSDMLECYHDRVRESVDAHLDEQRRRRLHGVIADALERTLGPDEDPLGLVRHLEAAGEKERAATQAEAVAARAGQALAFDKAAELYRMAIELGDHTETEVRELEMHMANALASAGRGKAAAEVFLKAAEGADPAQRLECQRRAAEQLIMNGHIEEGLHAMGVVLAQIGDKLPTSEKAALFSVLWQRLKLKLRGLSYKLRDASEIPASDLSRLDVYGAVAKSMAMVDNIRGADFQARALLLALKLGEGRRVGMALALEGIYYSTQGRKSLDRAWSLQKQAAELGRELGDPYVMAWAQSGSAYCNYFAGNFAKAVEQYQESADSFREKTTGTAWEVNNAHIFSLLAMRRLGAFIELRRNFEEYRRDAVLRGDRYSETTLTRGFNIVWMANDMADVAEREIAEHGWVAPRSGFHVQEWYGIRARAELDMFQGQGATHMERHKGKWDALRGAMLLRVQLVRAEAWWLEGRICLHEAALPANRARALAKVEAFAVKLAKEKMQYSDVWSRLLTSGVQATRGQRDESLRTLRDATALAEKEQMRLIAALTRRRRGELLATEDGRKMIIEADEWAKANGISVPHKIAEVLLPGFPKAP